MVCLSRFPQNLILLFFFASVENNKTFLDSCGKSEKNGIITHRLANEPGYSLQANIIGTSQEFEEKKKGEKLKKKTKAHTKKKHKTTPKMYFLLWFVLGLGLITLGVGLYFIFRANEVQQNSSAPQSTSRVPLSSSTLIDHVYYINLATRPDRNYQIQTELKRMGLCSVTRISGVVDSFGALGCAKAHEVALGTFENAIYQDTCLILEDDAQFMVSRDYLHQQLNRFMNLHWKWDIIMLGGVIKKYEPTDVDFVVRVLDAQTTSGYIIHRSFLPTLRKNFQEAIAHLTQEQKPTPEFCLDIYWKRLQPKSKWFAFSPLLIHQRENYSDIEKRHVSYHDHFVAAPFPSPIEYIVAIKTCQARFGKNKLQLETIRKHLPQNMLCFYYLGDPQQEDEYSVNVVDGQLLVTLKCKDDYLNLCHKLGLMIRFLLIYTQINHRCEQVKGVFFTDDDIKLYPDRFLEFFSHYETNDYFGKVATYEKKDNFSPHLINKSKESFAFHDWLHDFYPDLLTYPIHVPGPVSFCPGGGFWLSMNALRHVSQQDDLFVPFPLPNELSFHLEQNHFHHLHVFDDTEIAIALQRQHITPLSVPIEQIAEW